MQNNLNQYKLINNQTITSWKQFRKISLSENSKLLKRLSDFRNAILISGCQRSGTTMLARIITESKGMVKYWFGPDDELDAALILSGFVAHEPCGRYCFQTTYLDQRYYEYFDQQEKYQLIWVLRNPYSTVYSLMNNWPDHALTKTYKSNVTPKFKGWSSFIYRIIPGLPFGRLKMACHFYNWKVSQLFEIRSKLNEKILAVVEYDDLILNKNTVLPKIYDFIELDYKEHYADKIHSESLLIRKQLSNRETQIIKSECLPIYLKLQALVSLSSEKYHTNTSDHNI